MPDLAPQAVDIVYAAGIPSFRCFCNKVFYVSTFKDFNTVAPACQV
jgi:hypothetical protein